VIEWVTGIVESAGLPGVFALMFLENLFPPIPSELIMPLAGFVAARGGMSLWLAILAGTLGSVIGNGVWYEIARRIGGDRLRRLVDRHGRWFAVSTRELDRAEARLRRHGPLALFFGRLLPGIRTLISIPAGLAGIPRHVFYLWTLAGSALWVSILAGAGYLLQEQYKKVEGLLEPLSYVIVGGVVLAYLWHVLRRRRSA
jgi:membrane protein DedA with SNARE-associated domain